MTIASAGHADKQTGRATCRSGFWPPASGHAYYSTALTTGPVKSFAKTPRLSEAFLYLVRHEFSPSASSTMTALTALKKKQTNYQHNYGLEWTLTKK